MRPGSAACAFPLNDGRPALEHEDVVRERERARCVLIDDDEADAVVAQTAQLVVHAVARDRRETERQLVDERVRADARR